MYFPPNLKTRLRAWAACCWSRIRGKHHSGQFVFKIGHFIAFVVANAELRITHWFAGRSGPAVTDSEPRPSAWPAGAEWRRKNNRHEPHHRRFRTYQRKGERPARIFQKIIYSRF